MAILENLEPKKVFEFFEQMSAIPRGSYNTKAISDYLADFAKARNLEYYQDELNNVIIIKEATEGYENAEPVILQGHMDMVCQQAPDCTKDMEREGLDLAVGEDYVYAKGTTLGADDGIAVDGAGREVCNAEGYEVSFSATGDCRVYSTGSDLRDHTDLYSTQRRMWAGRISVAVLLGEQGGKMTLSAECSDLEGDSIEIKTL